MENNSSNNFFSLEIDATAKEFLKASATWARIIAIAGFISAGLSVFSAIFSKQTASQNAFASGGGIVGALIMAGITISINIFLLRFASNTTESINATNQEGFNEGISNLRVYFKFLGIIFIIVLSLFALGILFFLLGKGMG